MSRTVRDSIKQYPKVYGMLQRMRGFCTRLFRPRFVYLLLQGKYPLSQKYGLDRGRPIDRFYIEGFLERNKAHIRGRCLELLSNEYTTLFGGAHVIQSDVLDINTGNNQANIYGDLRNLTGVASDQYDCIILTQVLQFIDDCPAAIAECYRILKPGGVLLVTLPALSRVDCVAGVSGDFWRFTQASARYLFQVYFTEHALHIASAGNVLADVNFLLGMAQEDMETALLEFSDEQFPCIITIEATKQS